jgi:hypothetical protein
VRGRRLAHPICDLGNLQDRTDARLYASQLTLPVELLDEFAERLARHAGRSYGIAGGGDKPPLHLKESA